MPLDTVSSAAQPSNRESLMSVSRPMPARRSAEQLLNAEAPRAVRLSGRSMAVRALQPSNAEAPTVFSRVGSVMEVSF